MFLTLDLMKGATIDQPRQIRRRRVVDNRHSATFQKNVGGALSKDLLLLKKRQG